MTPEQRLDRAERILLLTIQAGRRARKEWNEKVNILIDAQIRNEEATSEVDRKLAELAESQKLTFAVLRAYLKGQDGKSK
jgi:hypothetical protein